MINIQEAKQLMKGCNKIFVEEGKDLPCNNEYNCLCPSCQATLSTTKLWVQDKIEGLKKDIEFLKDYAKFLLMSGFEIYVDKDNSRKPYKVLSVFNSFHRRHDRGCLRE